MSLAGHNGAGSASTRGRAASVLVDNITYSVSGDSTAFNRRISVGKGLKPYKTSPVPRKNSTNGPPADNGGDVECGTGAGDQIANVGNNAVIYGEVNDRSSTNRARKVILRDLTCMFPSGQLCAIMGPSGAGKSSLLDIVTGQKFGAKITNGCVYVDGKPQSKRFNKECAYVRQDDVLPGVLTVEENLMFSLNLRDRDNLSAEQKRERVNWVMHELGLERVAHSKIGTAYIRGISGGERKRVSIGMELVTNPSVVVCDEPTSGLDADTALQLVQLLKRLSRNGRTVILSIHQPRFSIFKLFDRLLLVSAGEVAYEGPASESVDYFASIGYPCEHLNNPADFFLDVIQAERMAQKRAGSMVSSCMLPVTMDGSTTSKAAEKTAGAAISFAALDAVPVPIDETSSAGMDMIAQHSDDDDGEVEHRPPGPDGKSTFAEKFKASQHMRRLQEDIRSAVARAHSPNFSETHERASARAETEYAQPFYKQVYHIMRRSLLMDFRNPAVLLLHFSLVLSMALLTGGVFFQLGMGAETLPSRVGALYFAVIVAVFPHMTSTFPIISDMRVFNHERSRGYYHSGAFFLAKITADAVVVRILPMLLYSIISYWMVGLDAEFTKFLLYTLTLVVTTLAASAICYFVSCALPIDAAANILVIIIYSFMMLFGGMLAKFSTIPVALRWIQWLSLFRYAYEILATSELEGKIFVCSPPVSGSLPEPCLTGDMYLNSLGFKSSNTGFNIAMLVAYMVLYLILAFLSLKLGRKPSH